MNFMNAIKKPIVVLKEIQCVSGLPPMLIATVTSKPTMVGFNTMRPSWADSDSEDENTESDRQRLADAHAAWMESRMQREPVKMHAYESDVSDADVSDADVSNADAYNYIDISCDSW